MREWLRALPRIPVLRITIDTVAGRMRHSQLLALVRMGYHMHHDSYTTDKLAFTTGSNNTITRDIPTDHDHDGDDPRDSGSDDDADTRVKDRHR